MKKVLFVSFTSEQSFTGGQQCSKRNKQSLEALYGTDNVCHYIIEPYKKWHKICTKLERIRDIFRGYMGGMKRSRENEIVEMIDSQNITDVFIDSSLLGLLAKSIKKNHPLINVIVFFHNTEYSFVRDSVKVNRDYFRFYWLILSKYNESVACRYADTIIALNERDALEIKQLYGRYPDCIIPITFKLDYHPSEKVMSTSINNRGSRLKALFVGSYFFGNTQGVKWFCNEVLPKLNMELTIVGSGMDALKDELTLSDKIRIYNDVPLLTPFFEDADIMVLPILSGSGMKVKTAEALMHGKYILGTSEALRGYNVTSKQAMLCDTADDFVKAVDNLPIKYKFCKESYKLFNEEYSFDISLKLFAQSLKML